MRSRPVALLLTAVLAFSLVTLGWRRVLLIRDGRVVTAVSRPLITRRNPA